jgi:hypothetical protein
MRFRVLLLAVLLAAGQVVFANHLPAHASTTVGNCDWCVCQGQTPAAPLPASELPPVAPLVPVQLAAVTLTLAPEPRYQGPGPRAPPPAV